MADDDPVRRPVALRGQGGSDCSHVVKSAAVDAPRLWMPFSVVLHPPAVGVPAAGTVLLLAGLTAGAFARRRPVAGVRLLPTLAWTCYEAYVTAAVWWLHCG
jgi:tryptophan-rich sensory protein